MITRMVVLAMVLVVITLAVTTPALAQPDHFNVSDNGVLSYGGDVVLGKCSTLRRSSTFPGESMQQKAARACEKAGFSMPGPGETTMVNGSPAAVPPSGGPAILLPAAALLLGSGILTYVILRRR
jgi:hypothetical protein